MIDQKTPDPWDYLAEFIEGNAVRPPGGQQVGPPRYPLVPSVAKELRGIVEAGKRALAAERAQHQQEIAAKDHEIAGLKSDVAFKDSLIWTSRESELYKATVAAEKDAKAARAERDALQVQVDKKAQAFDDECGRHEQTLIGKRGFADLVAQLGAERDAAQQQIEKAVDDEQRRIATHVWEKLVPIGVDATDSDGSDTEDPARHIVSWVVGLHDRVSGELVAAQQQIATLTELAIDTLLLADRARTVAADCLDAEDRAHKLGQALGYDLVAARLSAALQSTRPQEQPPEPAEPSKPSEPRKPVVDLMEALKKSLEAATHQQGGHQP